MLIQVGWNGQSKPDLGALVVFTGSPEVRDWQEGDTLKVLDYVAVLGTTDTVPVLWNLDRQSSDTAPVEALRVTLVDAAELARLDAVRDMMSEGPIDQSDREGFCDSLYRRGYRLSAPPIEDPVAPLE